MSCCNKAISIFKGFGTKWDNNNLLDVTFDSEISIVGFGAEFSIGDITKTYTNIEDGFTVNLTAEESDTLPLGPTNGTLVLIDLENNRRPFSTQLPFVVKDWESGDIQLDGFKVFIDASVDSHELKINVNTTNPLAINEETIRTYISAHNQDETAHTYIQDRITANTEKFEEYRTAEAQDVIDATFETSEHAGETYATKQELSSGLSTKQDTISDLSTIMANATAGKTASQTIAGYGNIVTHNTSEFATASQGVLAENALQPGDNITQLANNAGYITGIDSEDVSNALGYTPLSATDVSTVATTGSYNDLTNKPTIGSGVLTVQTNGATTGTFSANATANKTINIQVPTNNASLLNGAGYITGIDSEDVIEALGYTPYNSSNPNSYQTATQVSNAVDTESGARESADNDLQQQIDAITASSDVKDIVGTYAQLQAYDTSKLGNNDIIKVLQDETHDNETTYYRWSTETDTFTLIGEEGPYYTKSEANNTFVPSTRTVNGKGLYENITLTAQDVGALPSSTVIPTVNNATLTIQTNGSTVQTFTANQSTNVTANITVPTDTNDLTNGAGYITGITSSDVTTALGYTPYDDSNPDGYISGITSLMVTTALGYTPVNPSSLATVATTGAYGDLSGKPTVDQIYSGSSLNAQSGVAVASAISGKQDTLVSGTNIKTVNNNSLLGSGNISIDSLPSQTGQSGKFLTTDGTDASWATVDALPSQTGQSGKFLTTNGSDASWASVSANPDGKSITTNSSSELQTIGVIDQNNTTTALKSWKGTLAQYNALVSGGTVDSNTIYSITDDTDPSGTFANTDLSNLSQTGQAVIDGKMDVDFSNISVAGQQVLDAKLDANKIQFVNELPASPVAGTLYLIPEAS